MSSSSPFPRCWPAGRKPPVPGWSPRWSCSPVRQNRPSWSAYAIAGRTCFSGTGCAGSLLCQEGPPRPAVVVARVPPDLVDMVAGGKRPRLPVCEPGQPSLGDPRCQPPRDEGAQRPCEWCRQQPVPHIDASWPYARQQGYRVDPVRCQAGWPPAVPPAAGRVTYEHCALDATRVHLGQNFTRAPGEPVGRPRVAAVCS